MTMEAIKAAIPHREPFLLLDEIVEQEENWIVCSKTFSGDEFWYPGHYPNFPITPGVLLCEAAMQAGAVLLSRHLKDKPEAVPGRYAGQQRTIQADGIAGRDGSVGGGTRRAVVFGIFSESPRNGWW